MAAAEISGELNQAVMAAVKAAEERGESPLIQAVVKERGLELPSLDLGFALVSNLCFDHNGPSLWKLLEQAMASRAVFPLHVLALLTAR